MDNELSLPKVIVSEPKPSDLHEREKFEEHAEDKKEMLFLFRTLATEIEAILREYIELREDYYKLITVWILGCYLHATFTSYPYLFFNAMRGSGKSRTLKLITALADGEMLVSLKEAVLFRYPKHKLLVIDEFEQVASKDSNGLREILNASYKKGMGVMRAKRVKVPTGDEYILEKFEPYKPIAMANIYGMDEILGDRALTLILEKSATKKFSMTLEDFETRPTILDIKVRIKSILVQLCSYCGEGRYMEVWNEWVRKTYRDTYTQTTLSTHSTLTTPDDFNDSNQDFEPKTAKELDQEMFFEAIARTGINGRSLELFFPLLIISKELGDEWLFPMLKLAETMVKERRVEEMTQSKDVSVYDFVSMQMSGGWYSIKELTSQFRNFIAADSDEDNWVNNKWLGRALLRLNLIREKRRLKNGVEVILDQEKAREKLKMFKPCEEKKN